MRNSPRKLSKKLAAPMVGVGERAGSTRRMAQSHQVVLTTGPVPKAQSLESKPATNAEKDTAKRAKQRDCPNIQNLCEISEYFAGR